MHRRPSTRPTNPCWLVGLLASFVASPAAAQPSDALTLRWSAPPACADVDTLRRRIRAHTADIAEPVPVVIEARVRPAGSGVFLTVRTLREGVVGRRELTSASCAAAESLVVLLAGLLLDPRFDADAAAPPSLARALAEPATEAPAPAEPEARAIDAPPREHAAFSLATLFEAGALPAPTLGLAAGLLLRHRRLVVAVAAQGFFPRRTRRRPELRARLYRAGLLTEVCGRFALRHAALLPCGGLDTGLFGGRARALEGAQHGATLYLAGVAQGRVVFDLSERLELALAGALFVPFHRPEFVVNEVGAVHRAGAVFTRLGLHLHVRMF